MEKSKKSAGALIGEYGAFSGISIIGSGDQCHQSGFQNSKQLF